MADGVDQRGFFGALQNVLRATFGPGALGRLGTIALGVCVILAALGFALAFFNAWFGVLGLGGVFLVGMVALWRGFNYATEFPQYAAMDGAQIVRLATLDAASRRLPGAPEPNLLEAPRQNPQAELGGDS